MSHGSVGRNPFPDASGLLLIPLLVADHGLGATAQHSQCLIRHVGVLWYIRSTTQMHRYLMFQKMVLQISTLFVL